MYAVTADVGLLKINMIKLTGWNGILIDINVTDLWHPTVNVWRFERVICEAICHVWGYLSCVRLFVMCEAICPVWGYLSCVRLFVLCEAICNVWGYLSCVRLFVLCEAICPVWGYLSCVRLFVLCEATCPHKQRLCSESTASVHFQLTFLFRKAVSRYSLEQFW